MLPTFIKPALPLLASLFLFCGCRGTGTAAYPSDPLFVSKKPLQSFAHLPTDPGDSSLGPQVPSAPASVLMALQEVTPLEITLVANK